MLYGNSSICLHKEYSLSLQFAREASPKHLLHSMYISLQYLPARSVKGADRSKHLCETLNCKTNSAGLNRATRELELEGVR